jgi:hypothetical protein
LAVGRVDQWSPGLPFDIVPASRYERIYQRIVCAVVNAQVELHVSE